MEKKIILTGGGSAGHVTPNLALLPQLQAEGIEVHYIGTADGIERTIVSERSDITYHVISSTRSAPASCAGIFPGRTSQTRSACCAACFRRAASCAR